ncbi:hypothetical protein CROQUDRAFT_686188 [Cronartium quercuum f. sp. fusiforme G11]|uniref:Uncharacterized protein n=1 Tax=Cronartium quercuum f. sp. fusiforme G11 TaxID=708437 RepID=A0A9P6T6Q9_9BASI|nr:hypothetical protein CROQUDRAFT_686188 [Cronartium quercuum f. sp. fusiforme G11]
MADLFKTDPTLYLDKLYEAMYNKTGTYVPLSTVADHFVKHLELTRKKVPKVHPTQSPAKQAEYMNSIADFQPEMLVFAGEFLILVSQTLTHLLMGTFQLKVRLSSRNCTEIMAELLDGLLAVARQEGIYVCADFEDHLEFNLLPQMNPFMRSSSVLIIKNARIHHGRRSEELYEE